MMKNNMRSGFTMIELIFVIVIIGILAAVALPKFVGMTEQAKASNIKSFVGTMNRTILPTIWAESMAKGHDGDISALSNVAITKYIELPDGVSFTTPTDFTSDCTAPDTGTAVATYDIGQGSTDIYCFEGNATTAPFFSFDDNGSTPVLDMP